MGKVIGIGETVTDIIIRNGKPEDMVCGGSCFNSMISIGRCGVPATFIGEVGDDRLGTQTAYFLQDNNVDTTYLKSTAGKKSQLSLAFLNEQNNADYVFYKDHSGDTFPDLLPAVTPGDIVLYGSFFALNPIVHPALSAFLSEACSNGAIVYYDVNFRSSHLHERDSLASQLTDNFRKANIVRGSDEDFINIFNTDDTTAVYNLIKPHCDILIITRGGQSLDLITPSLQKIYPVMPTNVVSTVGAGDSFNAGVVYCLYSKGIDQASLPGLTESQWDEIISTAMRFSAEVCSLTENYISKNSGEKFRLQK